MKLFSSVVLLLCFVSCASPLSNKKAPQVKNTVFSIPKYAPKRAAAQPPPPSPPRRTIKTSLPIKYKEEHYNFWINYFTQREKARFQRHLNNGDKFRGLVESILKSYDLPKDIYFVGLIESGYNTHAKSHASAVGPWQFMKGTAKQYGMRVDYYVDERKNIIKSTHGAAKYLKDLYNILGSWELALCAYNAGENRVIGAIKRGKTRDYRELVKKRLIPKETIYYIPKLAAAREIDFNRKRYGFSYGKRDNDFHNISQRSLKKNFDWRRTIENAGISSALLRKLNPDIKRNRVRASGNFNIIVPKNANFRIVPYAAKSRRSRAKRYSYRVRPGDYLLKIARRHSTTVKEIKKINNLRSSDLSINQKLKMPVPASKKRLYVVRKGDNLFGIARKFNSTIKTIVAFNRLKTRKIYPKQKLYIPAEKYL